MKNAIFNIWTNSKHKTSEYRKEQNYTPFGGVLRPLHKHFILCIMVSTGGLSWICSTLRKFRFCNFVTVRSIPSLLGLTHLRSCRPSANPLEPRPNFVRWGSASLTQTFYTSYNGVDGGTCLARSRLTGLRFFFSETSFLPKKRPSPSAHSRWTPERWFQSDPTSL